MQHKEASSRQLEPAERIELRSANGPLLGVLVLTSLRLEVKRGKRIFEVDLVETMHSKQSVVTEIQNQCGHAE